MPFPNYTIGPVAPAPSQQGDLWYDQTNAVLNVHNGVQFTPLGVSGLPGPLLGAGSINVSQMIYLPLISASLAASVNVPSVHAGMCFDNVGKRAWVTVSGSIGVWISAVFA